MSGLHRSVLLLDGHMAPQQSPRDLVAVCFVGEIAAIWCDGVRLAGNHEQIADEVMQMEADRHPRWVFWSAQAGANPLVLKGIHLNRCWDIAEAHRLLVGGRDTDPGLAWATVRRLATSNLPRAAGDDLFDFAGECLPDGLPQISQGVTKADATAHVQNHGVRGLANIDFQAHRTNFLPSDTFPNVSGRLPCRATAPGMLGSKSATPILHEIGGEGRLRFAGRRERFALPGPPRARKPTGW